MTNLLPMSKTWLDREVPRLERERREQFHGVQFFSDEFSIIPSIVIKDGSEVAAEAAEELGPPVDPVIRRETP